MRKIGLCVRYNCGNYGSMLQIFATQKVLERMGCQYEHIVYDKKTVAFILKNAIRVFNPYFMKGKISNLYWSWKVHTNTEFNAKNQVRLEKFKEFREKYIGPYSQTFKGYNNLQKGSEQYDAVMVGSDQLWTPAGLQTKFFNLLFVSEHVRKISFATSFGVTEIPDSQIKLTRQYLDRIEYISVREKSGAELVEKLTGRRPVVALDPALMFSGREWNEFFPYREQSVQPYIFAFFLGSTPEHRELVSKFAASHNLKIITCPCMDSFLESDMSFGNEQRFDVSPEEFLSLIRGAEYVFTDSFHGSVFSILNHKEFITFNRYSDPLLKSKNTRIDSLFEILGIEKRHFTDFSKSVEEVLRDKIDYAFADARLEDYRNKTFRFLDRAIND